MGLREDIPALLKTWSDRQEQLEHNAKLFRIYEGDLKTFVLEALKEQLSPKSYAVAKHRVAPINILKRIIEKLSKIYAKAPVREIEGGSDQDSEVLKFYTESMDINTTMANANAFFNLFKNTFVEPYLENGVPQLRVVPSDRFIVYSNNPVNPMRPTHYMKAMGTTKNEKGEERVLFYAYTANEFLAFDDNGAIASEVMSRPEVAELGGKNPYGALPGVYINRSRFELMPQIDTDTYAMTVLIPIILSDLNYAVMYQTFSILYGIDVQAENIALGPNVFIDLKSDPNSDKTPSIGTIKPEVDIEKVMGLIKSTLSLWMQSRNIKPGAMGEIGVENAASGIAKAIDEMDTSEDRTAQIPYFIQAEKELFDFIVNHMHPLNLRDKAFKQPGFSSGILIKTTFAEQRPLVDTSKAIDDQDKKIKLGIQSRRGALKELYPDWSDEQIDEKLAEVEEERAEQREMLQAEGLPGEALLDDGSQAGDSKEGQGSMDGPRSKEMMGGMGTSKPPMMKGE